MIIVDVPQHHYEELCSHELVLNADVTTSFHNRLQGALRQSLQKRQKALIFKNQKLIEWSVVSADVPTQGAMKQTAVLVPLVILMCKKIKFLF